MTTPHQSQQTLDLQAICDATDEAKNESFSVEILYFAFLHMRDHPESTIEACIGAGFEEWTGK